LPTPEILLHRENIPTGEDKCIQLPPPSLPSEPIETLDHQDSDDEMKGAMPLALEVATSPRAPKSDGRVEPPIELLSSEGDEEIEYAQPILLKAVKKSVRSDVCTLSTNSSDDFEINPPTQTASAVKPKAQQSVFSLYKRFNE
jgi:hypothetical protein